MRVTQSTHVSFNYYGGATRLFIIDSQVSIAIQNKCDVFVILNSLYFVKEVKFANQDLFQNF